MSDLLENALERHFSDTKLVPTHSFGDIHFNHFHHTVAIEGIFDQVLVFGNT